MIARETNWPKKKTSRQYAKMIPSLMKTLIDKLDEARRGRGFGIKLIIGAFSVVSEKTKVLITVKAISISKNTWKHARVFIFTTEGKKKTYISSADWMVAQPGYRVEATSRYWRDYRGVKGILDN